MNVIRRALATAAIAFTILLGGASPALADTGLHQPTPISAEAYNDCGDTVVADGTTLWHFVLVQTEASSGLLSVTFSNPVYVAVYQSVASPGGTLHWNVFTPTGSILQAATTTADGSLLNLSHTCIGGPAPSSAPSATPSVEPSASPQPSDAPSPTPSTSPTPEPTSPPASPTPSSQPTASPPAASSTPSSPLLTPPPTDTAGGDPSYPDDTNWNRFMSVVGLTAVLYFVIETWSHRQSKRRR